MTLDMQAPILLLAGAAGAFLNWRSQKSGEMNMRAWIVRDEQPRFFKAVLIARWGLVAFAVVLAGLAVAGLAS